MLCVFTNVHKTQVSPTALCLLGKTCILLWVSLIVSLTLRRSVTVPATSSWGQSFKSRQGFMDVVSRQKHLT